MGKRTFILATVVATVLTTLAALTTVSRVLGKISSDLYYLARTVFLSDALPALGLGLAFIGLAVLLSDRHRLLAAQCLMVAPVAAMVLGMALFG